ncbi:hypothetical protein Acsp06_50140 [Actinomycetospora sp. NBRC 106375]|uniref:DUF488 domain-containing protein n=1 Tax=Actinomycetospora sp. NBRC 106375 TaxID=3032207 RepID=UPI0024A5B222|nr:DUF488 family protein [Actinomycetospora sp. NBRC 106375]GLZ48829.1 hypothetical protein Acsp06_50140 [Actinomycetospora sp. NBRC 106375]
MPQVEVGRVYDPRTDPAALRVLVDRVWPRGLSKDRADLDRWCRDVAPSTELRRWYGHAPERFGDFARRYRAELDEPERAEALRDLTEGVGGRRLILLTATRDVTISHATVLAEVLRSEAGDD